MMTFMIVTFCSIYVHAVLYYYIFVKINTWTFFIALVSQPIKKSLNPLLLQNKFISWQILTIHLSCVFNVIHTLHYFV